jgi:hypothetical protein
MAIDLMSACVLHRSTNQYLFNQAPHPTSISIPLPRAQTIDERRPQNFK